MDSRPLIYFVIVAVAIVYVHPLANDDAIEKANSDVDHELPVASASSHKVDAKSGKMRTADAIGFKRKADDGDQANARKYMKMLSLPKRSALSAFKNLRAKQEDQKLLKSRQDIFGLIDSIASGLNSVFTSNQESSSSSDEEGSFWGKNL